MPAGLGRQIRSHYGRHRGPAQRAYRAHSAVWLLVAAVVLGSTGVIVACAHPVAQTIGATKDAVDKSVDSGDGRLSLERLSVSPGEQIEAAGRGGLVVASDGSFELCTAGIGPAVAGASSGLPQPGGIGGCSSFGAMKIATLIAGPGVSFAPEQDKSVRISGTYNADTSITVTAIEERSNSVDTSLPQTPCPTPAAGWLTGSGDTESLNSYLDEHRNQFLVGVSFPAKSKERVTTVGTTAADVSTSRTELEAIYGAPICVFASLHSQQQLDDATAEARQILGESGATLWPSEDSATSPNLPIDLVAGTCTGYVLIISPALAEQLAPFSELITFIPHIRPAG